jgi:pyruvate/2-oxoglutarate dehydrogenase complex dihydrolipoamide dehydrogenase (E3) component
MGELISPDICVIGAGVAGITAALAAAVHGVPVVLVEKGEMGGAYLHAGGVASKAIGAVARRAEAFGQAKTFGLNAPRPKVDFYRVHDHIQEVIAAVAPNLSAERLNGLHLRVIRGAGRFKDHNTLAVGDIEIKARRYIIATGSVPAPLPIPGMEDVSYLTPATIFDLLVCPKHLVVIGATATGLELAQAYRRLGAEVTVLDAGQPLADFDEECAAIVLEQLEREGVSLRSGVPITRIKAARTKIHVSIAGESAEEKIEASHLLLTAGRAPNVAELDLAAAGIVSDSGGIVVDRHLKTSNQKVYAIGDVVRGYSAAHVARKHAELVIRHALFRMPFKLNDNEIPRTAFTQPELAQVGLTEAQARKSGKVFRVLRWPYGENDRAQAEGETIGHVKVVTSKKGKILGAAIVGAQASELITAWTLAIGAEINISAFAGLAMPSPTFSEIGKQAAATYRPSGLAPTGIRRIMAALRLVR